MPGGTARLRVSGAITRRLGSVIGPSLKGSNNFDWLMSGFHKMEDEGELGITAASAMPQPFGPCILPPHDTTHMSSIQEQRVAVHVGRFVRNQKKRSIADLPTGALAAERHCDRAVRPPAAGVAAHRAVDETGRDHIAANAVLFAGPRNGAAERDLRGLRGFIGRIAPIGALARHR